jgi:hypothetical protein
MRKRHVRNRLDFSHLEYSKIGLPLVERSNGTFQYLTGLPSFPDPQTLRRFLLHAPESFWEQMHRINDRVLQNFVHLPETGPVFQIVSVRKKLAVLRKRIDHRPQSKIADNQLVKKTRRAVAAARDSIS